MVLYTEGFPTYNSDAMQYGVFCVCKYAPATPIHYTTLFSFTLSRQHVKYVTLDHLVIRYALQPQGAENTVIETDFQIWYVMHGIS